MNAATTSPCNKTCTLDPSGSVCIGCFRTTEEIGLWSQLSDEARARIVDQLPGRRRRFERDAPRNCERCGAAFRCGAADPATPCWCTAYPPVAPSGPDAKCLCPACLAAAAD